MTAGDDREPTPDEEALGRLRTIVGPVMLVILHGLLAHSEYSTHLRYRSWESTVFGVVISQPPVLASIGLLWVMPLRIRYAIALVTQVLLIYLCISGSWGGWPPYTFEFGWERLLLLLGIFFLAHIPLTTLRYFRWQVAPSGGASRAPDRRKPQFQIHDLLIWTAGLAVLFSLGRFLLLRDVIQDIGAVWQTVAWVLLNFFISSPAIIVLLACLVRSYRACLIGLGAVCCWTLTTIVVIRIVYQDLEFVQSLVAVLISAFITGVVLRVAGLRLQRAARCDGAAPFYRDDPSPRRLPPPAASQVQ